jgi:hypothetical protein
MRWTKILLVVVAVYVVLMAGLFAAMRQPPERFGRIMSKVPDVAFLIFPFKPLWLYARGGQLKTGQAAPDFSLATADRKSLVQLSEFRGKQPVMLVFGSYT